MSGYVPGQSVTPSYFSTLGMPLLAGRTFSDRDVENARRSPSSTGHWPRSTSKGPGYWPAVRAHDERRRDCRNRRGCAAAQREGGGNTNGVLPDRSTTGGRSCSRGPYNRRSAADHRRGPRGDCSSRARHDYRKYRPVEERISVNLSQDRLIVFLASGFGALALGLAGFGLFGLLSYTVARRSSEFGIRMALGASRAKVQWSVVREALWLVLCGFLLGAPFVMQAVASCRRSSLA